MQDDAVGEACPTRRNYQERFVLGCKGGWVIFDNFPSYEA